MLLNDCGWRSTALDFDSWLCTRTGAKHRVSQFSRRRSQISGSASPLLGPKPAVGTVPCLCLTTLRVPVCCHQAKPTAVHPLHRIILSLVSRSALIYTQRHIREDLLGSMGAIQTAVMAFVCAVLPALAAPPPFSQDAHLSMPGKAMFPVQTMLWAVPPLQTAQLLQENTSA